MKVFQIISFFFLKNNNKILEQNIPTKCFLMGKKKKIPEIISKTFFQKISNFDNFKILKYKQKKKKRVRIIHNSKAIKIKIKTKTLK